MSDPKINLKKPWLAGVLTYFVPGAGHFYQGRYFKGVLYLVCVLGTFLYGMQLGEWRPVYLTENSGGEEFGRTPKRNFGFLAQLGLGTPAILAYGQYSRYHKADNHPTQIFENAGEQNPHEEQRRRFVPLRETIDAPFEGGLYRHRGQNDYEFLGKLDGQIQLEPGNRTFRGTFKGTRTDSGGKPQPVELELGVELTLDSKVLGDPKRSVRAAVISESQDLGIVGHVPRGFANWFCAPLDDAVLQDMNRRLNKRFEMALVYTWIAGLLNVLVIWDAVSGPAYGYSDDKSPKTESPDSVSKDAARKPISDEPVEAKSESATSSESPPVVEAAGSPDSTGGPAS